MSNIDYKNINDILDADFSTVPESDLRIAIETFQQNYKEMIPNFEVASTPVSDEAIAKLLKK